MFGGKIQPKVIFAGALGTIILGAVGSGLWDWALKPGLGLATSSILNIATLGMESLRDDLYQNVARDDGTAAGVFTLLMILALFTAMLLWVPITAASVFSLIKARSQEGTERVESPKRISWTMRIVGLSDKAKARFFKLFFGYSLIVCVFLFFNFIKIVYTNSAVIHFHQSLAITRPFMTMEQEGKILSRYARIRSKKDYIAVLSDLQSLASVNGLELPKFNIW